MYVPCNANGWQNNGFPWEVSWADQCKPRVMPMGGKTMALHGQFYGPTNVCSMLCQGVAKQWLYMGSFIGRPMYAPCNAKGWQNNGFTWEVS